MSAPGSHPLPPADLDRRKLPITKFSGSWFRTHASSRAALFFGKLGRSRFDAPAAEYGVLYVARREEGAFIETFGHDTGRHRVLDVKELEDRALSRIDVSRPLRLVDLRAEGLARLGADAELLTGAYTLSQAWSLALHAHPAQVDGIAYLARHDLSQTARLPRSIRGAPSVALSTKGGMRQSPERHPIKVVPTSHLFFEIDTKVAGISVFRRWNNAVLNCDAIFVFDFDMI